MEVSEAAMRALVVQCGTAHRRVGLGMRMVRPLWLACVGVVLALVGPVQAAGGHAHVHGEVQLGVALDGPMVTVDIDAPLESLLGFEHTPRTPDQRQLAARWVAWLQQDSGLWRFNAEAGCKLKQVDLQAPVIGLGHDTPRPTDGHADLEGSWTFDCAQPRLLKRLDHGLFERSPHAKRLEVKLLTDRGQSKQTVLRPAPTIWLSR